MKIDEKFLSQIQYQAYRGNQASKSDDSFNKALSEKSATSSSASSTSSETSSASGLMETSVVAGILAAQTSGPEIRVEQALSALDKYAEGLGDPKASMEDLAPLVDNLKAEAENMKGLSQELPEGHDLKGLADEVAILASVEAIKFDRGDFS